MIHTRRTLLIAAAATAAAATLPARATDRAVIEARMDQALSRLWKEVPGSRGLSQRSVAMLIMPEVTKGGFIVGGAYGEGGLRMNQGGSYPTTAAYYSIAAASVGFQAGIQQTSHALFFLTKEALTGFRNSDGWEVGADAEVTFPDAGVNLDVNSTKFNQPIVGIVFGEDGLLVGASLEGAKYSQIAR